MDANNAALDKEQRQKENALLNWYLIIGWGVIALILMITYAVEVVKGAFTTGYYIAFLCATLIPFASCVFVRQWRPGASRLRYMILAGYYVMYGFVLLTGHTLLVFTYVLPLLCLVILYHDPKLIRRMGVTAVILNTLMILRDYRAGMIDVINSRDYEIQMALVILCFVGCYLATNVYGQISELNKVRERDVLRLQEERIVLEERNRYALLDGLTGLGNRRSYDEDMALLDKAMPADLIIAIVDVNNLKYVNDSLGHMAGDELIVGVATAIQKEFDGCGCYRLGGDEFIISARESLEVFEARVDAFHANMARWKGIHSAHLSAAIGYASVQESDSNNLSGLMHEADVAMYQNKQHYYTEHPEGKRI